MYTSKKFGLFFVFILLNCMNEYLQRREQQTKPKSIFKQLTHIGLCTDPDIFKNTNSHQYSRTPKQVRKCCLQITALWNDPDPKITKHGIDNIYMRICWSMKFHSWSNQWTTFFGLVRLLLNIVDCSCFWKCLDRGIVLYELPVWI
jgi:hypothetical protein